MPPELRQPVNYDTLYPSRFLKAGTLLGKHVTLAITKVEHERLEGDKGEEIKAIVHFEKTDMSLVLAKTNGIAIKAMFGPILADWVGKRITLFEGKVESGSMKGQPCIRIWGSPDIPADTNIQIKLPKKKAFPMTMHKVDLKPATPTTAAPLTPEQA